MAPEEIWRLAAGQKLARDALRGWVAEKSLVCRLVVPRRDLLGASFSDRDGVREKSCASLRGSPVVVVLILVSQPGIHHDHRLSDDRLAAALSPDPRESELAALSLCARRSGLGALGELVEAGAA